MSAAQEFMNECTALEMAILKLKAEKAELLVALKDVLAFIDYVGGTKDKSVAKARKAITKATGATA